MLPKRAGKQAGWNATLFSFCSGQATQETSGLNKTTQNTKEQTPKVKIWDMYKYLEHCKRTLAAWVDSTLLHRVFERNNQR